MTWTNPSEDVVRDLLASSETIAVVGCSPNPGRTSHQIAAQMQAAGFRIIPVHPSGGMILGETVYGSLADIPEKVDIVDVFRRSEHTPDVAAEAVAIGARALWLQQGVASKAAYDAATEGGLICIMDACIAVWHRMLV